MATLPIWRATRAAWEVIPPKAVRNPSEAFIPRMSSGEVSCRQRITFSPRAAQASASSAKNTILPVAAPGPAGSPLARGRRPRPAGHPLGQGAPLAHGGLLGRGLEDRAEELVQRLGLHPPQRLVLVD